MRNGSVFWGVALMLLGLLLFAQTSGLLPAGINVWAIFWSLMLVGFGVSLLMRSQERSRALEGAEAGGGRPGELVSRALDGAQRGRVVIHHGAGELRVTGGAAPTELFSGSFRGGVEVKDMRAGDEQAVDLRTPGDTFSGLPFSAGELDWALRLNPALPLALEMELGASRNLLDLRELRVEELRLSTGASSTEIDLPARAGFTRARVRSGAASVNMRVPQGVAARIHAAGGLASIQVDEMRFPRLGNEFRSPDYDTAENRVDIDVEMGVGSVSVR